MEHDFREVSHLKNTRGEGGASVLVCSRCSAVVVEPPPDGWSGERYRAHVGVHETCEAHLVHEVMES